MLHCHHASFFSLAYSLSFSSPTFFNESAGLSYILVSFMHSSLETDLTFNVLVPGNGTASEGMVKCGLVH